MRLRRDLTQRQLSERSGVSLATLRRLEHLDTRHPNLFDYLALAKALQCTLLELLEPEWLEEPAPGARAAGLTAKRRPPSL